MNKLLTKIVGVVLGTTMAVGVGVGVAVNSDRKDIDSQVNADDSSVLWSSGKQNSNTKAITWTSTNLDVVQEKGSGQTAPNSSYVTSGPRWYSGNTITFSLKNGITLTSFTITATNDSYGDTLATSIGDGASNSNGTVTWTGSQNESFSFSMTGQSRLGSTGITFTYSTSSAASTTTSISTDDDSLDLAIPNDSTTITASVKSNNVDVAGASVTFTAEPNDVVSLSGSGNLSRTVTAFKKGKATITASYAGVEDTYQSSHGTIVITVVNSNELSVTFDATIDKDLNNTSQGAGSITKGVVTYTCDNGILGNGSEYRMYKNSNTVFSISSGTITSISFTGVEGNPASGFTAQTGWTTSGIDGTWEGSASSVTFVAGGAQVRATEIVVAYSNDGPVVQTYDITFNKNTEDTVTDMPETLEDQIGTVSLESVDSPSRDGYDFMGWSLTSSGETIEEVTVTDSDIELFAIWQASVTPVAEAARCYTLVEDSSGLVAGAKYIIASSTDYNVALSTTQNTNNRGQEDITISNKIASVTSSGVQVITLEATGTENQWALYTGSGYLYAASSSSNYLKTQTTNDANGEWKFAFGAAGAATVTAQGSNSRNVLKYNSSSSLFSCYASGQKAVYFYRLNFEATLLHNVVCDGNGSHTLPQDYTWNIDLKSVYDDLPSAEQNSLKTASNAGLERYDYIIGKYNPTGSEQSDYKNFIGRTINPLTAPRISANTTSSTAVTTTVVIISVISLSTLCGYFLLRKRKEQ